MGTDSGQNERRHHEIAAAPCAISIHDAGGGLLAPRADSSDGVRGGDLSAVVTEALQDVVGWKITADSKGFINALHQSFELARFEGAVQSKWAPRSYAVQTDLAGGISGAQAGIHAMARTILDRTLPLLAGLYPLKPDPDAEYLEVLRQLARQQLTGLVAELGMPGGPRVARVNQYFRTLIGTDVETDAGGAANSRVDPDMVGGTLGGLRDAMGLRAGPGGVPRHVNNVSDEQNVTDFGVVVDYINAILNSWMNGIR